MKVGPTIEQLVKDYPKDVKVVYKHFVVHPQHATTPALAACAAHRQNKFAKMEKLIWEKGFNANRNLSKENMVALAKEAGLNMDQFQKDLDGQTALMAAVHVHHLGAARLLLDRGADPWAKDIFGRTPIGLARRNRAGRGGMFWLMKTAVAQRQAREKALSVKNRLPAAETKPPAAL